jgi:hypothetical protein
VPVLNPESYFRTLEGPERKTYPSSPNRQIGETWVLGLCRLKKKPPDPPLTAAIGLALAEWGPPVVCDRCSMLRCGFLVDDAIRGGAGSCCDRRGGRRSGRAVWLGCRQASTRLIRGTVRLTRFILRQMCQDQCETLNTRKRSEIHQCIPALCKSK